MSRSILPEKPVVLVGGVVERRMRNASGDVNRYAIKWPNGTVTVHVSDVVEAAPPEWAQADGEEWRRVPSTMLMAWHPEDRIWIAEDLTRQGCWASAPTPDGAHRALLAAAEDYDELFGAPDVPRPGRTSTRASSLRGGVVSRRDTT